MKLSYTEIFKYSDILNPVSPTTLLLAGKLAQLGPEKEVLDPGSGKGYPSLLWASVFGAHVKGFEVNRNFVRHANSCAMMLNLSSRAEYTCRDVKELRIGRSIDQDATCDRHLTSRKPLHIIRNQVTFDFKLIQNPALQSTEQSRTPRSPNTR